MLKDFHQDMVSEGHREYLESTTRTTQDLLLPFQSIIALPCLEKVFLVVDALDEAEDGEPLAVLLSGLETLKKRKPPSFDH